MNRDEMIDMVRTALRALERMPADANVLEISISKFFSNYILTYGSIQQIAEALGTSPTHRASRGHPEEVITLEGGLEIVELCRMVPEGEP